VINEDDLFIAFRQLEQKIESMKRGYEVARKRIDKLQEDNTRLQQKNREQESELKELKQLQKKQAISEKSTSKSKDFGKIVNNNLSGTDTNTELKQQLDEYIRELERCIAHLSSLS
jgi:multidrug resistance efflux pump